MKHKRAAKKAKRKRDKVKRDTRRTELDGEGGDVREERGWEREMGGENLLIIYILTLSFRTLLNGTARYLLDSSLNSLGRSVLNPGQSTSFSISNSTLSFSSTTSPSSLVGSSIFSPLNRK